MSEHHICSKLCYGLIMLTLLMIFFVGNVAAGEKDASSVDSIIKINPVPKFDSDNIDYTNIAESYFDIIVTLDFVGDKWLVYSDHTIYFAPGFRKPNISTGTLVGIRLNKKGEVVECRRLKTPRPPRKG